MRKYCRSSSCAEVTFIERGSARGLDLSCIKAAPPEPFVPAHLHVVAHPRHVARHGHLDANDQPIGARLIHDKTKFTFDYLRIETAPQGFIWVTSFPTRRRTSAPSEGPSSQSALASFAAAFGGNCRSTTACIAS